MPRRGSSPGKGSRGIVTKPIMVIMGTAARAALHPSTVLYPYERIELPGIARCQHVIDWDKCIGCQLCSRVCPNECIYMEKVEAKKEDYKGPMRSAMNEMQNVILRPAVDVGHCLFCGDCQEYCPTNAYSFSDEYELADYARPDLYYSARELRAKGKGRDGESVLVNRISENPHLIIEKCIGCRRCERECPTRCIEMVDGPMMRKDKPIPIPTFHPAEEKKSELSDKVESTYSKCIGCSTCAEICPAKCIVMNERPLAKDAFAHINPKKHGARVVVKAAAKKA